MLWASERSLALLWTLACALGKWAFTSTSFGHSMCSEPVNVQRHFLWTLACALSKRSFSSSSFGHQVIVWQQFLWTPGQQVTVWQQFLWTPGQQVTVWQQFLRIPGQQVKVWQQFLCISGHSESRWMFTHRSFSAYEQGWLYCTWWMNVTGIKQGLEKKNLVLSGSCLSLAFTNSHWVWKLVNCHMQTHTHTDTH